LEGIFIHRATAKKHALKHMVKKFGRTWYIKEEVVDDYINFYKNNHRHDYKLLNRLSPIQANKILDEFININNASEKVNFCPNAIKYHIQNKNKELPKVDGRIYVKKKEIEELYDVTL
jgi:hypothetical protein